MIECVKGSLFKSPKGSVRLHAVNCVGKWGSGIAKEFARLYPKAYREYNAYCLRNSNVLGKSLVIDEHDCKVACLFTSFRYGSMVDKPAQILKATDTALTHLFENNKDLKDIHSNKFNSGLFHVPWEDTEELILKHLKNNPEVRWTVWEFNP